MKIKAETKIIYKKIIQKGSKQRNITGETQWKNYIPNVNFNNIWKKNNLLL